jgi:hypothetical protein
MKTVVSVSSAERFKPTLEELGHVDISDDYGVPERHQAVIKNALVVTLGQMGIPLESVVFSGYHQDSAHEINPDDSTDRKDELKNLTREIVRLQDSGAFDRDPSLKEDYQTQLESFRGTYNLKGYCFTPVDGLDGAPGDSDNPIHYAGMGENAIIGVYDAALLEELGGDRVDKYGDMISVDAIPGAIDEAKIMEFHPRFAPDDYF